MQKLLVYTLAAVMMWCSMGFVLWTCTRNVCYQYVRAHRMQMSARDTIIIPADEFKNNTGIVWMKDDEISYKGQMFDIKNIIKKGDKIILAGHYDKFENKLFKLLYTLLDNDSDDATPHAGPKLKWIADVIVTSPLWFNICLQVPGKAYSTGNISVILSRPQTPPFQPPRSA